MYRLIDWTFDQVNKRSRVLLQTPNRRSFGNCAEEIYYGLLKAKRDGKRVMFVYPRPFILRGLGVRTVNRELFHFESPYAVQSDGPVGLLAAWLLSLYAVCLIILQELRVSDLSRRVLGPIWPVSDLDLGFSVPRIGRSALWKPHGDTRFSSSILDGQHWDRQHASYTPPSLRADNKRRAELVREQMGIPPGDWFVCLHMRGTEPRQCRNASIENYIEGIKAVTDAGGWVVRLGDPSVAPLPPMARVIDYARSPYRSELMDMYLISECRFLVGMNSGPTVTAALFRRPLVLVNMTDWSFGMPLTKGDLGIIKHVFSRSRNRFLSIREILNEPVMVQVYGEPADDYMLVENTAQEIRELIEECMAKPEPYEHGSLQEAFNQSRSMQLRRLLAQGEPRFCRGVPRRDLFIEQYRIGAAVDAAGTLGSRYLKRNWLRDELNDSASSEAATMELCAGAHDGAQG